MKVWDENGIGNESRNRRDLGMRVEIEGSGDESGRGLVIRVGIKGLGMRIIIEEVWG